MVLSKKAFSASSDAILPSCNARLNLPRLNSAQLFSRAVIVLDTDVDTVGGIAMEGSASTRRARDPRVADAERRVSAVRWRVSESIRMGNDEDAEGEAEGVPRRARSWVAKMSRLGLRSSSGRWVGESRRVVVVLLSTIPSALGFKIATPPHCGSNQAFPADSGITKGLNELSGM